MRPVVQPVRKVAFNELRKLEKTAKELNTLQQHSVYVGVPKDAANYPDGTSAVSVAIWNEFGVAPKNIPARSFVLSTVRENDGYKKELEGVAEEVYKGRGKPIQRLRQIGMKAQADIRKKIVELKIPANAPSTIRKKGSDNPLVDTGHLIKVVNYKVQKNV